MKDDIVGIAELKSRLSAYLRAVRRGRAITVTDRDTPIARIVPIERRSRLSVRRPAPDAGSLASVPLPPRVELDVDVVDLLMEDRGKR